MNQFEKIHVEGFRRLTNVNIELRSLNVLIGANGSGKTSFLDMFTLMAAAASGRLNKTISEFHGIEANIGVTHAPWLACKLSMALDGDPSLHYRLALKPRGAGYEIIDETLYQQRNPQPPPFKHIESKNGNVRYFMPEVNRLERPNWEHDPNESALFQVPKMFQEPEKFRKRLASLTHYHVLDVSPRAPVRLPQQMRDAKLPGRNGEDLVSCLYTLRETDPDRFELVEDTLRAGFHSFERLNFPPVAAGMLAMTWKDNTSKHPFYMHQLSEGTLRFLWLVTLLQSPGLTAVTLIDEPEVSLHPELLSLLADLMREASRKTQLIVATHADRLVRYLKPNEVLTVDVNENGSAELTWADELDLEKWLDEYTLDEVWRLGRMGARS